MTTFLRFCEICCFLCKRFLLKFWNIKIILNLFQNFQKASVPPLLKTDLLNPERHRLRSSRFLEQRRRQPTLQKSRRSNRKSPIWNFSILNVFQSSGTCRRTSRRGPRRSWRSSSPEIEPKLWLIIKSRCSSKRRDRRSKWRRSYLQSRRHRRLHL